jgi:hypothetical protein
MHNLQKTCDKHKNSYLNNYKDLVDKGYTDMINECVKRDTIEKIKKSIEECATKLFNTQKKRLEDIKTAILGCKPADEKVEVTLLKPLKEKTITKPIEDRSKSERRRSYFD